MSKEARAICGVVSHAGPHGEPLACGFPDGHAGPHAWASLPTWADLPPTPTREDVAAVLDELRVEMAGAKRRKDGAGYARAANQYGRLNRRWEELGEARH